MDNKIIFPNFWTESAVNNWKQKLFDEYFSAPVALEKTNDDRFALPVEPIRTMYIIDREAFHQLTALFRMFGIEARVNQGKGIFGNWHWQEDWKVVLPHSTFNSWQQLELEIVRNPILRTVPILKLLLEKHCFYGLVIDQLKDFNLLLEPEKIQMIFENLGMPTCTYRSLNTERNTFNPSKTDSDDNVGSEAKTLVDLPETIDTDTDRKESSYSSNEIAAGKAIADEDTSVPMDNSIAGKLKVRSDNAGMIDQSASMDADVSSAELAAVKAITDANPSVTIVELFGANNAATISVFHKAGIVTLSDLTIPKLRQVFNAKGIGPKRIQRIMTTLQDAGVIAHETNDGFSERSSKLGPHHSKISPVNKLIAVFTDAGMNWPAGVDPASLSALTAVRATHSSVLDLVLTNYHAMAETIPDQNVYTAFLPLGEQLYKSLTGDDAPEAMSIRLYLLLFGLLWLLPVKIRRRYEGVAKFLHWPESEEEWNKESNVTMDTSAAVTGLRQIGITLSTPVDESVLKRSVDYSQKLLPASFDELLNEYWQNQPEDSRKIILARHYTQPMPTLKTLAKEYDVTRERIRQKDLNVQTEFLNWWDDIKLALKLFIVTDGQKIDLETLTTPANAALVLNCVVAGHHDELESLICNTAAEHDSVMTLLSKLTTDQILLDQSTIRVALFDHGLNIDNETLRRFMEKLNFREVEGEAIWTRRKSVSLVQIIECYMQSNNLQTFNTDTRGFHQADDWSKRYFDKEIAPSERAFRATLSRVPNLMTIGNGKMIVYNSSRYPDDVLKRSKQLLDARFSMGYHFARDNWLLDRVKSHLPDDVTSDEWYQAFKRKYPQTFNYSPGRNNDIFPLKQTPLTTVQQIVSVARDNLQGCDLVALRRDYGWEDYTVTQAVSTTNSLYLQGDHLFWIDLKATNEFLTPAISKFLTESFQQTKILTVLQVYSFFNEYMMSLETSVINRMRIFNVEGLCSYLNQLSTITVVDDIFVLPKEKSNLPLKGDDVWSKYLAFKASTPLTRQQIDQAAYATGISESTWVQSREKRIKAAGIVSISPELWIAAQNIVHTPDLDRAVTARANALIQKYGMITPKTLIVAELTGLSEVQNRDFPEQTMLMTAELFVSYGEQLGFRRLLWPKKMFQNTCDVLVNGNSVFRSMQELAASLMTTWLESTANESVLYERAMKLGIVPQRQDPLKWRFPDDFMAEQGFEVDELGNVRRQGA